MPKKVKFAGTDMTLGWEIVHDWILPKDAKHGIGLLTINHLLKTVRSFGKNLPSTARKTTSGYRLASGGKFYVIALGSGAGDVVTCYQVDSL